ncbi:AB hydrolase superfamily protein YvaM [compost metagenome]
MSYIDTGGNKPALVMLHGLGSKKEAWIPQLGLSNKYRLIIPTLRGHDDSPIIENITLNTFANDIIDLLLNELNIHKVHLLGLSLGGIVTQEILKQRPDIVQSTILSNTASVIPYHLGSIVVKERQKKLKYMTDEEYIREVSKGCLYDIHNEKLLDDMSSSFFKLSNRSAYLEAAKAPLGINYIPTLMCNKKPMLIMGSLHDKVTPYSNQLTTKMFAPFAKLKMFEFSGHVPNVENWQEFNENVLEFLEVV